MVVQLKGSVKELNMFHNYETDKVTRKASVTAVNLQLYKVVRFFHPRLSLNRVLFPMFCLLVGGECLILVF